MTQAYIYAPATFGNMGADAMSQSADDVAMRSSIAPIITFWTSIIFLFMAIFRLGALIRFLSHPVMTGFVTAAAMYIFFSQVKYILDLHVPHYEYNFQQYKWMATNLKYSNPWTILIGGLSFIALLTVKILKKKFPPTDKRMEHLWFRVWHVGSSFTILIALVFAAMAARALTQARHNIPVVGHVEPGLSKPAIPNLTEFPIDTSLFQSIPVALLAHMEAYAVGRKFAEVR